MTDLYDLLIPCWYILYIFYKKCKINVFTNYVQMYLFMLEKYFVYVIVCMNSHR